MFSSFKILFNSKQKIPSDWIQIGEDIQGDSPEGNFGHSVSLSKDGFFVVVGSPQQNGYVKTYRWDGSDWLQIGSTILGNQDRTGWSVNVDANGQNIIVGSPYDDANGANSGKVSVYEWKDSDWNLKGQEIFGEVAGDQAGYSVDISDDGLSLYIGAIYNDSAGKSSGQVRVYDWDGSNWIEDVEIRGKSAGDLAGFSVSGNGNVVAFGSIFNDESGVNSGKVIVQEWNGTSWQTKGQEINGEASGDQSGFSLSMNSDGNILAIGAPFNDGNGTDSGHVRVYEWLDDNWTQRSEDIDGETIGDGSGHSVSINDDGTIVSIGAIYNDDGGTNSGHVRIYQWKNESWLQMGLDIDGENSEDQSGSGKSISISADGKTIAIGAPYNDTNGSNSGHVRIFKFL